jgi:hypothetical protein
LAAAPFPLSLRQVPTVIFSKEMIDANPYEPPSPSSLRQRSLNKVATALAGAAGFVAAIGIFGIVGSVAFWIVWLFRNSHQTAGWSSIAAFLIIAPWATSSPVKYKIAFAACAIPAIVGGYAGSFIFFELFRCGWFSTVFNDAALGPVGLVMFVLIFASLVGGPVFWLVAKRPSESHNKA